MQPAESQADLFSLAAAWFGGFADPVLLCDRHLRIVALNRAAADLLGELRGDLMGKKAEEALPPAAGRASHAPQEWRSEIPVGNGKRRTLEISGLPLEHSLTGVQGWALKLRECGRVEDPPLFVARSAAAQELLEFVSRIAASSAASILLSGESGTGKELIAKRLHCQSRRAGAPFIAINCAALPEMLLESELFGYEKGAFTGASEQHAGLLEAAHGGTLFLDEIGELSLPLQAKLLRALEDRTFRRVGGSQSISVDLRVIGATNVDLEREIENRRFRHDLYYRLNVVQIHLPSLRERPEDIPEMAVHFLDVFNRAHGRQIRGIHPGAMRLLETHAWPGNVRELRNVIERAVLTESEPLIMPARLAIPQRAAAAPAGVEQPHAARLSLKTSERELIAAALAEADGNQTRAANLLGIGRFSLRYKMKKLGLLGAQSEAQSGAT